MIQIESVKAQIYVKTTNAKITIESPPAYYEMNTKQAKILIQKEPLQIRIDQSQCFNESGLMNNEAQREDNKNRGDQAVLEGIARMVSEGNQMAMIENGVNMISEIAYNGTFDIREYDLGTMPKSKPQIDFTGGELDIKVDDGYVQINTKPNMPRIDYEAGSVETAMSQQPSISIRYVGENIDKSV